jgi:hypothetical protein
MFFFIDNLFYKINTMGSIKNKIKVKFKEFQSRFLVLLALCTTCYCTLHLIASIHLFWVNKL